MNASALLVDSAPDVQVDDREFVRLLGYPRGHVLVGRALELAQETRRWYAAHGRPWVYARKSGELTIGSRTIDVDGVTFTSDHLRRTLAQADAHAVVLVAVSAGPEIEREAHRAWLEERPDEYFFFEMFGSAVVEHLTTMTGARLCAWADGESMAILPHYSPGYPEWDIADQQALFSLMGPDSIPGALDVMESGMLRPKKSLLAVLGVTRHTERVQRLSELVPCQNCSFEKCQFRRAPSARGVAATARGRGRQLTANAAYGLSTKALRRWASERLSMTTAADGSTEALFRYDGTTCSNMGRPLAFHYRVTLGPREEGYVIREQVCAPVPGDDGHEQMCEYLRAGDALIESIAEEKPLAGRPLDDVLGWDRPAIGPGCYCESSARQHKWGIVLETIHYALTHMSDTER